MSQPRPEVGHTQGVEQWAEGEPYCRIVCTRDHAKRTIDRIRWAGPGAKAKHLYTTQVRATADPLGEDDPGSSAEFNPVTDKYTYRLRCACGLNVGLNDDSLEGLARRIHDAGIGEVELLILARR